MLLTFLLSSFSLTWSSIVSTSFSLETFFKGDPSTYNRLLGPPVKPTSAALDSPGPLT